MKFKLLTISFLLLSSATWAQSEPWSLDQCIKHALTNNLQIKQSELTTEAAKTTALQGKLDLLPTLNAGASHGYNWGQTIDPFTNQFATDRVQNNSFSLSSSVTLFAGFQKQSTLKQRQYDYMAARFDNEKMQNDISMQIATNYLQILFNQELFRIAENQFELTKLQVGRIRSMVEIGQLPKGNLLDLEAQLANEELNRVNTENQLNISILSLKQLLQLSNPNFSIVTPDLDATNLGQVGVQPMDIYKIAVMQRPEIKSSTYRLMSAEKAQAAAIGSQSPRLTVNGSYGTGYSGNNKVGTGDTIFSNRTIGYTENTFEKVIAPSIDFENYDVKPFKDQWEANINQSLSFQLSIPLFNGWNTRTSVKRAKINYLNAEMQLEQSKQQLSQDIQSAHNDVLAALKQYEASKKAVSALEESFKYAQARYEGQLINTIDYTDSKNKLTKAQSDLLRSKFDFIFKSKVLDFYQGKPLAL
ncbi:MAG: outer membrane protein [Flavobacteriales bacterium]|jgi:outer membrane protein